MSWKQTDPINRAMALADVLAAHDAIELPNRSTEQVIEDTRRLLAAEERLAKKMLCSKRAAHKLGYQAWTEKWLSEAGPSTEGAEGTR